MVPIHTETTAQVDGLLLEENGSETQNAVSEISLLDVAVLLVKKKRFILRFVLCAIVLAIVLALVLPVTYEAQAVLLPPAAQSSSLASALLGQIGNLGSLGSLSAVAGGFGMKTPTDMYVSLLKSRTVEDATIQRFGLMSEYKTKRLSDARKVFESRANVVAGQKDGLIRITVEDHDAKRAAEIANGYVEEFKKLSASLAITEAARRRLFFEQQLEPAKEQLAAAEEAMRKTQQETGVLQIDSQARALIESTAVLRAQVVAKEVQIQGMRSFATDDNPEIILAKQQLTALQSQLEHMAGSQKDTGSDIVLSKGRITGAGLEYLRNYRDLKYHETVYELLTKELEIAKLDEAREGEIVQVVDAAVTPDKKASPHRTLIVIGATILAFFLAVFYIIARRGLERTFSLPENRERLDAMKACWKRKPDPA
ncbi:MAG TPA: GNVR domain-containing protein [Candidatus Sulfotelmatobacter sp.]|nr:GNVR domain-containing protein [Candidatus Sulfotelmatobacter sp.]